MSAEREAEVRIIRAAEKLVDTLRPDRSDEFEFYGIDNALDELRHAVFKYRTLPQERTVATIADMIASKTRRGRSR